MLTVLDRLKMLLWSSDFGNHRKLNSEKKYLPGFKQNEKNYLQEMKLKKSEYVETNFNANSDLVVVS